MQSSVISSSSPQFLVPGHHPCPQSSSTSPKALFLSIQSPVLSPQPQSSAASLQSSLQSPPVASRQSPEQTGNHHHHRRHNALKVESPFPTDRSGQMPCPPLPQPPQPASAGRFCARSGRCRIVGGGGGGTDTHTRVTQVWCLVTLPCH